MDACGRSRSPARLAAAVAAAVTAVAAAVQTKRKTHDSERRLSLSSSLRGTYVTPAAVVGTGYGCPVRNLRVDPACSRTIKIIYIKYVLHDLFVETQIPFTVRFFRPRLYAHHYQFFFNASAHIQTHTHASIY